jgi:RNA polymerase sigma factor (sigma-70 family)
MSTAQLGTVLRHIHKLAGGRASPEWTDRQLLDRFAVHRDEAAFAALIARHGPMVLRVCRRVLGHEHDAEDAFQATFLALARYSGSIRQREALAGWLHGVAYRTALKAKRGAARRRAHEARRGAAAARPAAGPTWDEVRTVLDEEVRRLPEPFRVAFVLCCLEGKSRPEAAAELGCKEGTVCSRLARARQQLQQRLARRGIELSALLAALTLAEGAGKAAVPAALARATLRFGLLVAAGEPAAGSIPPHLAALAEGVTGAMSLTKAKSAAILLALGLLAGAGALTHRGLTAREAQGPPAAPKSEMPAPKGGAKPQAAGAKVDDQSAVTYSGRVQGPDGQTVAGAKVYYYFVTRADEPIPIRAVTDARGRFSFTLAPKDVPLSADAITSDPRQTGHVVVKADGFTFAWLAARKQTADLTLRLARDDAPVEGRIVDLQGKPVAGLGVSVLGVAAPDKGDLAAFLKALESRATLYEALSKHVPNHLHNPIIGRDVVPLLPSATTDAGGRFRLRGFAREQLVHLRVEGPPVETQDLWVMTRPAAGGPGRVMTPPRRKDPFFGPDAPVLVLGNGFEHALAPGQTVAGTVRDQGTGRPIPGAVVESYILAGTRLAQNTIYHTTADGQGRYRFTGLPRGQGNRIRIRPPKDQPYLPVVKGVPPSETFAQATVDVALERGVWVDVTAADKVTGRPLPGYVSYFALPEKPSPDNPFERPYADAYNDMMANRNDGTFRFVAAPRRAIVAFRADWNTYPIAREAATIRLPSGLSPSNFQAFAEINPKPGDGPVKVAFDLDARHVVKGKLIGPDGRPVSGVLAAGLRHDWFWGPDWPLPTGEFTALGLDPARPRLLGFAHWDRKLAGSVVVRGDEAGPVTVKLVPWGTVSGRLLDVEGKPIKNATLWFTEIPVRQPGRPRATDTGLHVVNRSAYKPRPDPRTDEQGRFRVEGLIPGLKYSLALVDEKGATRLERVKWEGLAFRDLVWKPGETKDLGDVKLQPFPKE